MKKIKFIDLKNIFEKNSINVSSKLSDQVIFDNIKSISNADKNDLSFLSNIKYLNLLKKIKAKACIIEEKYIDYLPNHCSPIIVKDPYLALALTSQLFNKDYQK